MNQEYLSYCGIYCENCAVVAKITPTAKALYNEMNKAGYAEVIHLIPDGAGFWPFLKNMAENGACSSCKGGGADPNCAIRICAKEKGQEVCVLCTEYPCPNFVDILKRNPILVKDNILLRDQGLEVWAKLQDERQTNGFTYQDAVENRLGDA